MDEQNHLPQSLEEAHAEILSLRSKFTKLDQPRYSGVPMMDSVLAEPSPAFREWVSSLPATYWARYDLSAARIGWEAGRKSLNDILDCLRDCKEDSVELLSERSWWEQEPRSGFAQRYADTKENVLRANEILDKHSIK